MDSSTIDSQAIGQRLRAYRMAAQLRAEEVADSLQISRAAVYRLEKGEIVKIDTLERLARLLNTSLSSLLGVDIEYYSTGIGFFERMRQLEQQSTHIYSHFDPFSFLLTSPEYLSHLATMLDESVEQQDWQRSRKIEHILAILKERKNYFSVSNPQIRNLIGLRHIERFLHLGLIGDLNISPSKRMERSLLARKEILYLINLLEEKGDKLEIAITKETVPSLTFQIFYQHAQPFSLAISPFRLGELPNVTTGIASITASPEAIKCYQQLFEQLWQQGVKQQAAIDLLKTTLDHY